MVEQYRCRSCGDVFNSGHSTCPNDGSTNIELLKPGLALCGPYTYQAILGQGGMGLVFKAQHVALKSFVAIKMLKTGRLASYDVRRFQKEGQAVSSLKHPGIVHVYDLGVTPEGVPFMVMDLIDGKSLKDLIEVRGALLLSEAIDIALQITKAMEHAHEKGIIHRDLKPSNIMLIPVGYDHYQVKIVDFGIAKVDTPEVGVAATLTNTGEILGSPAYMSPEQAKGTKVGFATDIYSVGCILFECLTGAPPFSGNNIFDVVVQHINTDPPPLNEASMGRKFPASVEKLISKALAKEPGERFASFTDMSLALESIAAGDFEGNSFGANVVNNKIVKFIKEQKIALVSSFVLLVLAGSLFGFNAFKTTAMTDSHKPDLSDPLERLKLQVKQNKLGLSKAQEQIKDVGESEQLVYEKFTSNDLIDRKLMEHIDEVAAGKTEDGSVVKLGLAVLSKPVLEHLSKQTKLLGVSLIENEMGDSVIPYLAKMPLQSLDLGGTKITDAGLAKLRMMKTLQNLNIRDVNNDKKANGQRQETSPHRITLKGLTYLTEMPLLRVLDLSGDYFSDDDLAFLPHMNHLQSFIMHAPQKITPACSRYIGEIKSLRNLQIGSTPIKLKEVSALKNLTQLNRLQFDDWNEKLKESDIALFISKCKNLEYLDINGKAFDSKFVRSLAALHNLTQLEVFSTRITVEDKHYLEKKMPGCHIDFRYN
jgi:serine/threonine protein kinase